MVNINIFPMAFYYAALIYNPVPDVNYGLSAIYIWSISRFDPVTEIQIN